MLVDQTGWRHDHGDFAFQVTQGFVKGVALSHVDRFLRFACGHS